MRSEILVGDCLDVPRTLPAESVHLCVTSPPYYGLRDYSIPPREWPEVTFAPVAGLPALTVPAQSSALGLEADLWAYVAHLVAVFREVRRVLRDDSCLWLNLGDSYCSKPNGPSMGSSGLEGGLAPHAQVRMAHGLRKHGTPSGLKHKDLLGVPWRVALALQADGWYLRCDVIWSKANPMPESVTDRPTKAHEYLFLLAKSPRYYYDADAIREPHTALGRPPGNGSRIYFDRDPNHGHSEKRRPGKENSFHPAGRNRRSVWEITTHPFPEAHFATMPPALVRPCILAGTSERGVCPACGAPWARVVERGEPDAEWRRACGADSAGGYNGQAVKDYAGTGAQNASEVKARILAGMKRRQTAGWQPTCACDAGDPAPATVLDPFSGAGTTGVVCRQLGRSYLGIELNPEYAEMSRRRIERTQFQPPLPLEAPAPTPAPAETGDLFAEVVS